MLEIRHCIVAQRATATFVISYTYVPYLTFYFFGEYVLVFAFSHSSVSQEKILFKARSEELSAEFLQVAKTPSNVTFILFYLSVNMKFFHP
jgi:hypothetical protein